MATRKGRDGGLRAGKTRRRRAIQRGPATSHPKPTTDAPEPLGDLPPEGSRREYPPL
jgi:hypothetical protein